jgi:hypothetical protein
VLTLDAKMLIYQNVNYICDHDEMKKYFCLSIDSRRLLPYICENIEQRKIDQMKLCEQEIAVAA